MNFYTSSLICGDRPKMEIKELHAYIQGPAYGEVIGWIVTLVKTIENIERNDLSDAIDRVLWKFKGKQDELLLEEILNRDWLELTIRVKRPESVFYELDNIQLGENLVDDLGGVTLVSCGGVYTHPLSDQIVRVSKDKLELVMLPESIGDAFDESLTKVIKRR